MAIIFDQYYNPVPYTIYYVLCHACHACNASLDISICNLVLPIIVKRYSEYYSHLSNFNKSHHFFLHKISKIGQIYQIQITPLFKHSLSFHRSDPSSDPSSSPCTSLYSTTYIQRTDYK